MLEETTPTLFTMEFPSKATHSTMFYFFWIIPLVT